MLKYGLYCLLIAIVVSALLRLSQFLWRPLAILLRLACGLAALAMGFFGIVVIQTAHDEDYGGGIVFGGFAVLLCLSMLVRLYRTRGPAIRQASQNVPKVEAVELPKPDDWIKICRYLSWSERRRVDRARTAIEAFLAELESPSLSTEHNQLALTLKERVPQLLAECLRRCASGSPSECRRYAENFCQTYCELGKSAEVARTEVRQSDDHRLNVLHEYFAQAVSRNRRT